MEHWEVPWQFGPSSNSPPMFSAKEVPCFQWFFIPSDQTCSGTESSGSW